MRQTQVIGHRNITDAGHLCTINPSSLALRGLPVVVGNPLLFPYGHGGSTSV